MWDVRLVSPLDHILYGVGLTLRFYTTYTDGIVYAYDSGVGVENGLPVFRIAILG